MTAKLPPSIFNDVIGPVMRGPSSPHSAASIRIGHLARDLCGGTPDRVRIQFDTLGSLATTHDSQGSDMGLFGGLLGWAADGARLPPSATALAEAVVEVDLQIRELHDPHPNTYRLTLWRDGVQSDLVAVSTGGGMIEVIEIDGREVSLFGDYAITLLEAHEDTREIVEALEEGADQVQVVGADPALVIVCAQDSLSEPLLAGVTGMTRVRRLRSVLPVGSRKNLSVPFLHASEMCATADTATRRLSDFALDYEPERGGIRASGVMQTMAGIRDIMANSVAVGLAGTQYEDRILPQQSHRFRALQDQNALLDGGLLNTAILYVTALMEAKSAMEVIVAAPTAGSPDSTGRGVGCAP